MARSGLSFFIIMFLIFLVSFSFAGSIWNSSNNDSFKYLISDRKATRVGDIVTIVISESSLMTGSFTKPDFKGGLLSVLSGIISKIGNLTLGDFIPVSNISTSLPSYSKSAKGETKIVMSIAAFVKGVDDNGNLILEGKKEIKIGEQGFQIIIRGTVKPDDIDADNKVESTKLADATIIYDGKVVFRQKPNEDRWFEWILSSLAGVIF